MFDFGRTGSRVAIRLEFLPYGEGVQTGFPPVGRNPVWTPSTIKVGWLVYDFTHEKSAVGARLIKFGLSLRDSPPILSRAKLLIFLCGASVAGAPSPRRQALQRFIHTLSDSHTVIYAEGIFSELARQGHKKNILDLEHEISQVADKVLIILESESAFCELGAFAGPTLREKLIIVNSSRFRTATSFVNQGPIAAAIEAKAPVLWYPMVPIIQKSVDSIGAIFPDLKRALVHRNPRSEPISKDSLSKLVMNKYSLYFVHDLVLICGPVSHEELVIVLKSLFPKERSFDALKNLLGVLRESGLVVSQKIGERWIVRTTSFETFLKYGVDVGPLMASFRTFHLKNNPERYFAA